MNASDKTSAMKGESARACQVEGCAGTYERRLILHCLEVPERGRVCIDDVPALVCPVCGDVEFELETVRRLEEILSSEEEPGKRLDVYAFEQSGGATETSRGPA